MAHHAVRQRILLVKEHSDEKGGGSRVRHLCQPQERSPRMHNRDGNAVDDAADDDGFPESAVARAAERQQKTLSVGMGPPQFPCRVFHTIHQWWDGASCWWLCLYSPGCKDRLNPFQTSLVSTLDISL